MTQPVSVGRIVHYAADPDPGGHNTECRAALVTEVCPEVDDTGQCVSLAVFDRGVVFPDHVCQDEQHRPAGTWHWPERV